MAKYAGMLAELDALEIEAPALLGPATLVPDKGLGAAVASAEAAGPDESDKAGLLANVDMSSSGLDLPYHPSNGGGHS